MPEVWLNRPTGIVQILDTGAFHLPSLGAALTQLGRRAPLKRGNEQLVYLSSTERGIFVNFKIKPR